MISPTSSQTVPAIRRPPLGAVVIGTGRIAEEHLRFLERSSRARLLGVCDLSPALAELAAGRFSAPRSFTDHRRMLEELRPDVAHVLTPPRTHREIAGDCLERGADVIVEKPAALGAEDLEALWSLARSNGRALVEDHNYRFNRPVLAIERLVRDGKLGDVREVDVRLALAVHSPGGRYADRNLPHPSHELPAGIIHEFITHLAYLALLFLPPAGKDGLRVAAAWSNHEGGELFRHDDLDAIVVSGPVHARLRFSSRTLPESLELTVRGTRGWASTDLFRPCVVKEIPRSVGPTLSPLVNQWCRGWHLVARSVRNLLGKVGGATAYEGLHVFLDRAYRALSEGGELPVGHEEMARAVRLTDELLDEAHRI